MKVSIIIPTLNEARHIGALVGYLKTHGKGLVGEIIVSDGNSEDDTVNCAKVAGATVLHSPQQGRAVQMNHGAAAASGDVFWFVHADTRPPDSFAEDLRGALENGDEIGGYRFRFDSNRLVLRLFSWGTRLPFEFTRGGDQTMFITRDLFERLEGFKDDFVIMEEYELMQRAQQETEFRVIPKSVIVSTRKYTHNNWLKVTYANIVAFRMFKKGAQPAEIKATYHRLIKHPKDNGL